METTTEELEIMPIPNVTLSLAQEMVSTAKFKGFTAGLFCGIVLTLIIYTLIIT